MFGTGIAATFLLSDFVVSVAKDFPVDAGIGFGQEVVELIDFIELRFDIEERRRTMVHKDKRKKSLFTKNTLFAIFGEGRVFLEVPYCKHAGYGKS